MNRRSVFQEFTIVVSAKQKPDRLWVPDIRINPELSPETRGSLNKDFAFKTRTEAEEHGMKNRRFLQPSDSSSRRRHEAKLEPLPNSA